MEMLLRRMSLYMCWQSLFIFDLIQIKFLTKSQKNLISIKFDSNQIFVWKQKNFQLANSHHVFINFDLIQIKFVAKPTKIFS